MANQRGIRRLKQQQIETAKPNNTGSLVFPQQCCQWGNGCWDQCHGELYLHMMFNPHTVSSNTTKCYPQEEFANKHEIQVALALKELHFSKEGTPGAIWWLKQVLSWVQSRACDTCRWPAPEQGSQGSCHMEPVLQEMTKYSDAVIYVVFEHKAVRI